jgi:hypothetical protein
MRRPIRLYALFAGAAAALFGVAMTAGGGLLGFVAGAGAAGCAAAAWGTAVLMASVHRVSWPLILSTVTVVAAAALFLISRG